MVEPAKRDGGRGPDRQHPFSEVLGRSLRAWRDRGRLADLLGPCLEWIAAEVGAERAIVLSVATGGGLKVRASRDADGETIRDADRWISPYVIRRSEDDSEASFFPDTQRDRRFRTEIELELGLRIRSMLVIPVGGEGPRGLLYLDSRFRQLKWPSPHPDKLAILIDLVAAGLHHDALERRATSLERKLTRSLAASLAEPAPRKRVPPLRAGLRELDFHGFRTCCPELLQDLDEVERLARSSIAVLVEGESGTGKEVLARALHEASGRDGPFVSLHCGAVPEALVEIELYGHARGAFTGAEKDRAGLFEIARGGTIFLDDVGEMAPAMQVALLRVLETKRFRPVSAEEEREADVRVIGAALIPPGESAVPSGLRPDLYYRLAGATVRVPPLRHRREDILLLARLFVERHRGEAPPLEIGPAVESELLAYEWPGNVRELENVIRRVIALGDSEFTVRRFQDIVGATVSTHEPVSEGGNHMQSIVDRAEREAIIRALRQASGNKSEASKILGLSRKTLYRRMEKHGIPL